MFNPNRQVVSFCLMFHWTDQKIRVHIVYCVLAIALAIAKLMAREVQQSGLDLSVREKFSSLAGIQETVLLLQGRPRSTADPTDDH